MRRTIKSFCFISPCFRDHLHRRRLDVSLLGRQDEPIVTMPLLDPHDGRLKPAKRLWQGWPRNIESTRIPLGQHSAHHEYNRKCKAESIILLRSTRVANV
eukprot:SAG31_NODE_65_length_28565_cov_8.402914_19_plen_100_part_00